MVLRMLFGTGQNASRETHTGSEADPEMAGTRRGRILEFLESFSAFRGWIETLRSLVRTLIAYIVNLFFPTNSSGNNLSRG